jgi:GT2 family glycosyltransferase
MCVSIITINFNTSRKTIELLESVKKFVSTPHEVIVVDNCSSMGDFEHLSGYCDRLENVILIRNKVNSGFGAGNMLGCNYARHPYLAFINNDAVLLEDSLTQLKQFMEENTEVAVVTPQQVRENGELRDSFDYFHDIRKTLLGRWSVELFIDRSMRRSKRVFDQPVEVDFVQGCFMFFRASAFFQCGGFDTNLFLYCEEMDICYRLRQFGYKSYFYPHSKFQHESGGSSEPGFAMKTELKLSYLYVMRKHHNFLKYSILKYHFVLLFLFKGLKDPRHFRLAWDIWSGRILQRSIKQQQYQAKI